jgi:hypothetical protein
MHSLTFLSSFATPVALGWHKQLISLASKELNPESINFGSK